MRTTEIGSWTPATGVTPGIRRPVRTITLPPIPSRMIRFGLPTSSAPSGVIVAAFSPRPASRMAEAACSHTALAVSRLFSRHRSKRAILTSTPISAGSSSRSDCSKSSWPV